METTALPLPLFLTVAYRIMFCPGASVLAFTLVLTSVISRSGYNTLICVISTFWLLFDSSISTTAETGPSADSVIT